MSSLRLCLTYLLGVTVSQFEDDNFYKILLVTFGSTLLCLPNRNSGNIKEITQ